MIVVGMDVHVRNSFLCVTDADGRLLRRGRVGNTLGEIAQFLSIAESQDKESSDHSDTTMRVVMESTTNSRAIHRMMLEYGREIGRAHV